MVKSVECLKEIISGFFLTRKKQTDAEEKKLAMIQLEIQKIDLLVSSDIKYLRSTIEEASLDFLLAQ